MTMATARRATGYEDDGDDEIRCSDNAMRGMNDQSSAVEKRGFFNHHRACADARV